MEWFVKSFDSILLSVFAVGLAVMGRLARLLHEDAHGIKSFTFWRFVMSLPDAFVVGIVAVAITYTLTEYFKVPLYAAIGLAGALGYLGLEVLMQLFGKTVAQAIRRFIGKKADEDA